MLRLGLRDPITTWIQVAAPSDSLALLLATAGRPFICVREVSTSFLFLIFLTMMLDLVALEGYYLIPSTSPFRIGFGECASPTVVAPVNKRDR